MQDILLSYALLHPAASWAVAEDVQKTPLDNPVLQEAASKGPGQGGFIGWLVLFSPLIIYGIFTAYRVQINPKAKLSNFALLVAGAAVIANIISILIFKIRWF